MSFFETFEQDEEVRQEAIRLPEVPPWPQPLLLQHEKEVLGLYVTSHPLAQFAEAIHFHSTAHTHTLRELPAGTEVIIGGIIARVKFCVTKNGRGAGARMAMFTLEDLNGAVDGVIFPDGLAQYEYLMMKDSMVFLRGTVDFRREDPSIKVLAVYDMNCAEEFLTHAVYIELTHDGAAEHLAELRRLCETHPGKCPTYVEVTTDQGLRVVIQTELPVRPSAEFCRRLEALVGHGHFRMLRPHDRLSAAAAPAAALA
jgi:DNA polymerase-3 subunit alpha